MDTLNLLTEISQHEKNKILYSYGVSAANNRWDPSTSIFYFTNMLAMNVLKKNELDRKESAWIKGYLSVLILNFDQYFMDNYELVDTLRNYKYLDMDLYGNFYFINLDNTIKKIDSRGFAAINQFQRSNPTAEVNTSYSPQGMRQSR